jgi:hypothetical protein|tara:strand:- start:605 stop:1114 length:510 start_codon:yes stop_codon:yes gene_type:complete
MADKGTASLSASVGSDFAKKAMGGNLNYTPADTGDKWIYLETIVDSTTALLIQAGAEYSTRYGASDAAETITATGDIVRWIALKHTGTTDGSTATTDGVVFSLEGAAAYDNTDGIFIDTGEMVCFKTAATTLNTLSAITVTVTNGAPASGGSPDNVLLQVAAILDDVDA